MARYNLAFTTPAAAAGASYVDFRTTSTDRARILELVITSTAATANLWSLERTTTLGTATAPVTVLAGEPGDPAGTLAVGVAWSVAPANTGAALRSIQSPAQIGAGISWTFGYGDLVIPVSSSLAIFNRGAAAGAICRGYVVIDE